MLIYCETSEAELQSPFLLWISSRLWVTFLFVVLYFFLSQKDSKLSEPLTPQNQPQFHVEIRVSLVERGHICMLVSLIVFYDALCHLSLKRNVSQVNTEWQDRHVLSYPFLANIVITFIGFFLIPLMKGKGPIWKYSWGEADREPGVYFININSLVALENNWWQIVLGSCQVQHPRVLPGTASKS